MDDSLVGQAMFAVFTVSCLFVTGAVAILALINTWWLLAVAFAFHVLITTIVGLVVGRALSGRWASS
ncbi:MAG TPA: hypothetical protein VKV27_10150 [Solirubrobacteraceae bacterium]|nr:hypothetical protein [Solirubrobacteraceae bacterium]